MHNGTVFSTIMGLSGYFLCKWGFLWGFEFVISKMIGNLYPQNSKWEEQC